MKKIMKKVLSLVLVIALAIVPMTVIAAEGDSSNPISVVNNGTVTIANGEKVYCTTQVMGAAMMGGTCDITVTGATGFKIYGVPSEMAIGSGETSMTDTDGTATISSFTGGMMSMMFSGGKTLFAIENTSGSEQTYTVKAELPKGTMDNPELVEFSVNPWSNAYGAYVSKKLAEGSQGYYYTCTAPADGAISVQVSAFDPSTYMDLGWTYAVNNITAGKYGDTHWSDEQEIINPEMVPVAKDDVLVIMVNTYDPNSWVAPAAMISVNLGFYSLGDAEYPDTAVLGENTATVKAGTWGYNYTYKATEAGTIKVAIDSSSAAGWQFNVNNLTSYVYGDVHTSSDTPVVSSDEVTVAVGDELQIVINTFDPADSWNAPAGTVKWTLSYTTGSGSQGGGNPGGGNPGGGNLGGNEDNYEISSTVLQLGDNAVTLSNMYEWTLFEFTPDETGEYKFQTDDGVIGYWGAGTFFVTEPDDATLEGNFTQEVTAVGQSVIVGIKDVLGGNTCNILITRIGDAQGGQSLPVNVYANKVNPVKQELPLDASKLEGVDVWDDTKDKAVLGEDGYYHLNKEDGPILFVNLTDSILSLADLANFGAKEGVYDNGSVVSMNDYTQAILDYVAVASELNDEFTVYPLTEDLMTFYQKLGAYKYWYEADPVMGTQPVVADAKYPADEAWMFACYYQDGLNSLGGTTGGSTGSTSSPQTGDNTNVVVWALAMMVGVAAAATSIVLKKRER